jgi:hypothetical protein
MKHCLDVKLLTLLLNVQSDEMLRQKVFEADVQNEKLQRKQSVSHW